MDIICDVHGKINIQNTVLIGSNLHCKICKRIVLSDVGIDLTSGNIVRYSLTDNEFTALGISVKIYGWM